MTTAPTRSEAEAGAVSLFGTGFGLLLINSFSYHLVASADRFTFSWLTDVDLTAERWTGTVVFALGVPVFCLVLIAGAVADRSDRRRQLLLTQLGGFVVCTALAILTRAGLMNVPLAIVGALCFGIAFAFAQPVRSALIPALAPREHLTRAIVLMTIAGHVGLVAGPAIAGRVIDARGVWMAFATQAGLFAISSSAVFRLHPPPLPVREGRRSLRAEIGEGIRYVAHHRSLRALFFLMSIGGALMMGAGFVLLPRIARDDFGHSADDAGLLFTAMGIGLIATSVLIMKLKIRRRGLVFMLAMITGLLNSVAQGMVPNYRSLVVLMFVWGISGGFYANLNQALIQGLAPIDRMGRVMSLATLVSAGIAPLGSLAAVATAGAIGSRPTLGLFGAIGLVGVLITLARADDLRALA